MEMKISDIYWEKLLILSEKFFTTKERILERAIEEYERFLGGESSEPLMTYGEVARYTNYSQRTIKREVKRGRLPKKGLPSTPRFSKTEVDAWLAEGGRPQAREESHQN